MDVNLNCYKKNRYRIKNSDFIPLYNKVGTHVSFFNLIESKFGHQYNYIDVPKDYTDYRYMNAIYDEFTLSRNVIKTIKYFKEIVLCIEKPSNPRMFLLKDNNNNQLKTPLFVDNGIVIHGLKLLFCIFKRNTKDDINFDIEHCKNQDIMVYINSELFNNPSYKKISSFAKNALETFIQNDVKVIIDDNNFIHKFYTTPMYIPQDEKEFDEYLKTRINEYYKDNEKVNAFKPNEEKTIEYVKWKEEQKQRT